MRASKCARNQEEGTGRGRGGAILVSPWERIVDDDGTFGHLLMPPTDGSLINANAHGTLSLVHQEFNERRWRTMNLRPSNVLCADAMG